MMNSAADFSACRTCACAALRHATRALTRHYETHFRATGLRATQFTVLATLAQTGALSMSELADRLGLERTTLSRNIRLLEEKGWVMAIGHDDQRLRRMQLTTKGRKRAESALPAWKRADASAEKVLRRFGLQSRPSRPSHALHSAGARTE
jgi:DNA-binding MarR family transcriptional regulator